MLVLLLEGEEHVAEEVPECGDTDGKDPEDVEAPVVVPRGQQTSAKPEGDIVDAESDDTDEDELEVLHAHLLLMAAEGPDTVEDVVGGGCGDEADGVGHKRVESCHLFQQVEHASMHHHPRSAYHAKF